MGVFRVWSQAIAMTLADRAGDLLTIFAMPRLSEALPEVKVATPWISSNLWSKRTTDGAVLFGTSPAAGAKYALPKGLPGAGQRTLAIENEPHTLEGFDGVIESGYGKGRKSLLFTGRVPVKCGSETSLKQVEYHMHDADVAGLHYDLAIAGLPEGTKQFELNIPNGVYKGRYSFVTTPKGMIVVPMKDRSVVLPKPDYKLKNADFLADVIAANPQDYVITRKEDGSLGNAVFGTDRAYLRSHRETASAYTDKLPALEFLRNRSAFGVLRAIDPHPKLSGTVLKGELVHQDGVGRVSGILNSLPEKAQAMQAKRGPVQFDAWDIVKLRGKDVSHLPAVRRRELLEDVINEVRRYNRNWSIVERYTGDDPVAFYQSVIQDPRGLPYAEGIVVEPAGSPAGAGYYKFKNRDFEDFVVVEILPSKGIKYADSAAVLVVRDPVTGAIGEVGSFAVPDAQRQWIWDHREDLKGAVAKVSVMEKTEAGMPRAGVFHGWHPDPRHGGIGTEMSLAMYSEALAGGDPEEAQRVLYRMKSSAGWKRAA